MPSAAGSPVSERRSPSRSQTHRHQGLATILLVALAAEAEQQDIRFFVAEVLPDNREMLAVFSDGFDASRTAAPSEVDIEFPTSAWRLVASRLERAGPTAGVPVARPSRGHFGLGLN
jgi:hypothetical protein